MQLILSILNVTYDTLRDTHLEHELAVVPTDEDHLAWQPVTRARAAHQKPWCHTHVGVASQDLLGILGKDDNQIDLGWQKIFMLI